MTKKRIRSHPCICDNEKQCHGMSLAFRMLEDPRGGHVEVPPPSAQNPEYEFLHRMNGLRHAYFRHLNPHYVPTEGIEQEDQYVALHHFPPRLVRKLGDGSQRVLQVPPTLRPSELRRLGWKPLEADRVYDANGQATEEYYCVPNYPMDAAHMDLKKLIKSERSTQEISTKVYQNAKKAIEARKNGTQQQQLGPSEKQQQQHYQRRDKRRSKSQTGASTAIEAAKKAANTEAAPAPPEEVKVDTPAPPQCLADVRVPTNSNLEEAGNSKPENFMVIGLPIPEQSTNESQDLGDSNAALAKAAQEALDISDKTHLGDYTPTPQPSSRDVLDVSDKTYLGEYSSSTRDATNTNNMDASYPLWESARRHSSLTIGQMTHQQQQEDLGASNTTVTISNLYNASAVSLQVKELMQTSSSSAMFHASDITEKASGAGPKKQPLHGSDTTIQTSNITAEEEGPKTAEEEGPKTSSSPAAEKKLTAKQVMELGRNTPPRPPRAINTTTTTTMGSPQSVEEEFPLEVLPRRTSEVLPACETRSELTTKKSVGNMAIPDSPTGNSRFRSSPKAVKVNDSSPMTPRRMVSKRTLDSDDDLDDDDEEEEKRDLVGDLDQAPANPERKQSILDIDVEEALGSFAALSSPMDSVKESELENATNHSSTQVQDQARRSLSLQGAPDDAPPLRRGSTTQLALLGNRVRKFHGIPQSGQSVEDSSKDLPARSWSGDSLSRRSKRRYSCFLPGRSKSDSSTKMRRRSDTLLWRRGASGQMSDSSRSSRSILGASRCIDTTRRAMQQFSDGFQVEEEKNRGRHGPRRLRSAGSEVRSRSNSPSGEGRRGRRAAIFGSDGDELVSAIGRSARRRTPRRTKSCDGSNGDELVRGGARGGRRPPRRTKSCDSSAGLRRRKRSSDPSPSRSNRSSRRGVRRTKSVDGTSERISRRMRIQEGRGSRKSSLSPSRTTSERSPLRSGTRTIKRLDTTKRAMQQFVHDTGTGSGFGSDRSPPRRSPRRTKSRVSGSRGSTPTRQRSPRRKASSRLSDGSDQEMSSSSPAAVGAGRVRLHGSLGEMNFSSPAIPPGPPSMRRATTDIVRPSRSTEEEAMSPSDSSSHESREAQSSQSSDERRPGLSPSGSDAKLAPVGDVSEVVCEEAVGSQPDTRGRNSQSFADAPNDVVNEVVQPDTSERSGQSIAGDANTNNKTADHLTPNAEVPKADTLSESLHMVDFAREELKATNNEGSLRLEDATEGNPKSATRTASILSDLHFSYPIPRKPSSKKGVDWESIGFYSSFSAISKAASLEEETGPTTFGLPWRLVGKKARQQLLAEVVLSAHKRQGVAAKKRDAIKKRQSQAVMKEVLAAVRQMEATKADFGEQVAKSAETLFKRDKAGQAGQLDAYLRQKESVEPAIEQTTSLVSLGLSSVFAGSEEFDVNEAQKSQALEKSEISLSLRRVFEDSELGTSQADAAEKSGSWGSEQLRSVFPFKTLRDKKKGSSRVSSESRSSRLSSESALSVRDSQEHLTAPQISAPSPAGQIRGKMDLGQGLSPASSDLYAEKLPDISEEDTELERTEIEDAEAEEVYHDSAERLRRKRRQSLESDLPPLLPMPRCSLTKAGAPQEEAELQVTGVMPLGHSEHTFNVETESSAAPTEQEESNAAVTELAVANPTLTMDDESSTTGQEKSKATGTVSAITEPMQEVESKSTEQQESFACATESAVAGPILLNVETESSGTEQEESLAAATESAVANPVPLDVRAKMAALLQETKEQDVSFSTPTPMSEPSSPRRNENGDEVMEQTQRVEFHLAFPPALALVPRALPPTADVCLGNSNPNSPRRGHSRPTTVNTFCDDHFRLDKKIDIASFQQEIQFFPSGGSYLHSSSAGTETRHKELNESMEKARRLSQDPMRGMVKQ